jgi:hypothetical protein
MALGFRARVLGRVLWHNLSGQGSACCTCSKALGLPGQKVMLMLVAWLTPCCIAY